MTGWLDRTHQGDCCKLMRAMIADGVRVQCIVTSPPYYGLRDYGVPGAYGLERSWVRHLARLRYVFRLCRELLAEDGVLWLNYGDAYYSPRLNGGIGSNSTISVGTQQAYLDAQRGRKSAMQRSNWGAGVPGQMNRRAQPLFKPKDLMGMPWTLALLLRADGWWLRSDVIWAKPNPMPESTRDRPTKAHEYLFMLTRSELYYSDFEAIKEPASGGAHSRHKPVSGHAHGQPAHSTTDFARPKAELSDRTKFGRGAGWKIPGSFGNAVTEVQEVRNARTVWTMPAEPFAGAHFATFPQQLARRCILAGSRIGDTVFDPFMGSGTVAQASTDLGRRYIGAEINPAYIAMAEEHRKTTMGLPL